MYGQRHEVSITTDASGDATAYTEVITGEIRQIIYTKSNFANGVDFVVTVEETAEVVWDEDDVNASAVRAPRIATHSNAGVAALYAGGGSAVLDRIFVANSRIKIVVASGGNATTGTITVIVG